MLRARGRVLAALAPVSDGYACLPVSPRPSTGPTCAGSSATASGISWRSAPIRRADADEARLADFDERAHLEAASAPGFVHYFKGPRRRDGSCLSFCLWTSPGRGARRRRAARPRRGGRPARRDVRALHARVPARDRAGRRAAVVRALRPAPVSDDPAAPSSAAWSPAPVRPRPGPGLVPRPGRRGRRRSRSAAMAPPIEVTSRIIAWTSRAIANAASRSTPKLVAMPTAVSSNVPR